MSRGNTYHVIWKVNAESNENNQGQSVEFKTNILTVHGSVTSSLTVELYAKWF